MNRREMKQKNMKKNNLKSEKSDSEKFEFAQSMISSYGKAERKMHDANRPKLWALGLPFYTILSMEENIHKKEYPDGRTEFVHRYVKKNGDITDELIKE
jgi:hypothetical protein